MKTLQFLALLLAINCLFSCQSGEDHITKKKSALKSDSTSSPQDSLPNDSLRFQQMLDSADEELKHAKPVFGYRFIIEGDFNGDGKHEKLIEHYQKRGSGIEMNKFYEDLSDYFVSVRGAMNRNPWVFLSSTDSSVSIFDIAGDSAHSALAHGGSQVFGLSFLKNEGDLNGDGNDDISYVVQWADWSNLNTWHIATFTKGKWHELYAFPIWDWQLPDLPSTISQYGLFGLDNMHIAKIDSIDNAKLEKELLEFKGLVKNKGNGKIRVTYQTDDAEEGTKIVDLKKL